MVHRLGALTIAGPHASARALSSCLSVIYINVFFLQPSFWVVGFETFDVPCTVSSWETFYWTLCLVGGLFDIFDPLRVIIAMAIVCLEYRRKGILLLPLIALLTGLSLVSFTTSHLASYDHYRCRWLSSSAVVRLPYVSLEHLDHHKHFFLLLAA